MPVKPANSINRPGSASKELTLGRKVNPCTMQFSICDASFTCSYSPPCAVPSIGVNSFSYKIVFTSSQVPPEEYTPAPLALPPQSHEPVVLPHIVQFWMLRSLWLLHIAPPPMASGALFSKNSEPQISVLPAPVR